MKKYLITGFSGFVSNYFLEYLNEHERGSSVMGLDINPPDFDVPQYKNIKAQHKSVDLLNSEKLQKIIYDFRPDYVLHLASYSSVAFSWKNPMSSFYNNTNIFLNLLEQIREIQSPCRILSIGSSEEYGNVRPDELPLTEKSPVRPLSPYAVARVSQEMLSRVYVDGYGLDIVITRSFNHIGPRQKDIFVVSSFARQLMDIKKNNKPREITTGDLSIIRDFLDVRDVVKAYHMLFLHGLKGEVYNICRGEGTTLLSVVNTMENIAGIEVSKIVNPQLIRPNDNPIIIGSNQKLIAQTGWAKSYSLEQSLRDMVAYWEDKV
ncbi:GDP-mannose 4,6-dehydratase [soil metagenome]